ncbi:MAG: hypothetical protein M3177_00865 [Pseudomonadota bacterium]|nr:hypothetical protein [Pseudomonadota bacterium]
MPPQPNPQALAASLVVAGGSGTAADVAAVRPEIAKLSLEILNFLIAKDARVVACRGSVTDVAANLRNVVPRGWENLIPRRTWDHVPGTYLAEGRRVIVATVAGPGGARIVPGSGVGHGSANLAVHETLHARHRLEGRVLRARRFRRARNADFARLPEYLRQEDVAGLEETYAESGARFFQRDPGLAADWPGLFAYWSGTPLPAAALEHAMPAALQEAAGAPPSIGTAELADDGTITLDLRAARRGALGHALIVVRADDPDYEKVRAQHFPRAGKSRSTALESATSRTVLVPRAGKD